MMLLDANANERRQLVGSNVANAAAIALIFLI